MRKLPEGCLQTHYDPNRHVDAERVIAWLDDPERQPAIHAFTAGLERQVAYRVEALLSYKHTDHIADPDKMVSTQNPEQPTIVSPPEYAQQGYGDDPPDVIVNGQPLWIAKSPKASEDGYTAIYNKPKEEPQTKQFKTPNEALDFLDKLRPVKYTIMGVDHLEDGILLPPETPTKTRDTNV